jgi:hypothetical protein
MSSPAPSTPPKVPPAPPPAARELRIYGHSTLFYWWPIWLLGFIFCLVSYFSGGRAVVVSKHAVYIKRDNVKKTEEMIKLKGGKENEKLVLSEQYRGGTEEGDIFYEHMSPNKTIGVVFLVVLLIIIFVTNVPLRGIASAVFISAVLVITLFFALMGWWDEILAYFNRLSVHMNAGFYGFFSVVLFIIWALVTFVFDRMSYWRVTPGQITHEFVFGGGQTSYDTEGIAFKKLRDDLFRHWVLGLGSGDLMMYPLSKASAGAEDMSIHNVLFINSKMARIQQLIAVKLDTQ